MLRRVCWCYLKKQTKADPLIVSIDFAIICFAFAVSDTRVWHFLSGLFEEHTLQRICAVDPAVSVEYIFRNIFCVDAINWITNVLSCGDDERESNQHHYGN